MFQIDTDPVRLAGHTLSEFGETVGGFGHAINEIKSELSSLSNMQGVIAALEEVWQETSHESGVLTQLSSAAARIVKEYEYRDENVLLVIEDSAWQTGYSEYGFWSYENIGDNGETDIGTLNELTRLFT